LEILVKFFYTFSLEEVKVYAEVARQMWFRRNNVVHGGDFLHPNDLIVFIPSQNLRHKI
jgi:hypothetical protein